MIKYIFFILFFISSSLFSKAVVLKNGKVERGEILTQSVSSITLKKEDGSIININRSDVLKISFKEISDEEAKEIMKKEEKKAEPAPAQSAQLDADFLNEEHVQNKQIIALTEEVVSLSRELESQKQKLAELEKKITPPEPPKFYQWDVVKKSAIFPGYGQFSYGEPVWGGFYSTLFFGGVFAYQQAYSAHLRARETYQDISDEIIILTQSANATEGFLGMYAGTPALDRANYIDTAKKSNQILDGILGIYFINMIDALIKRPNKVISPPEEKKVSFDQRFSPEYSSFQGNLQTGVQFQWQASIRF